MGVSHQVFLLLFGNSVQMAANAKQQSHKQLRTLSI